MPINASQIAELIEKLLHRTQSKTIVWNATAEQGKYQARHDNFMISLSAERDVREVTVILEVRRLDGVSILKISTSSSPVSLALSSAEPLPSEVLKARLKTLYDLVNDKNEDLDRLLRML